MGLLGRRLTTPCLAWLGILAAALSLAGGTAQAAASACRALDLHVTGTGERVVGAEDIAIDHATGIAYIAAYDRRAVAAEQGQGQVRTGGGIYALALADLPDGHAADVTDLTAELGRSRDFRPHGIDLYRSPDGSTTLFAVNRAFADGAHGVESDVAIEVFDLTPAGLSHRGDAGTLRDPLLCSPNDIAAAGPDSFYVTNDRGACSGFGRMVEDVAALDRGYVLHFDGATFRRVADGIAFANGIALRPAGDDTGAQLLVAATRGPSLEIFDLDGGFRVDAEATLRIDLPAAPDNLSWGPDGALYAGAHPNLLTYAAFRGEWLGRRTAPSRVLRIDPQSRSVTEIYADDGRQISGVTVAAAHGGMLLLGSAYDAHVVVCRLEVVP